MLDLFAETEIKKLDFLYFDFNLVCGGRTDYLYSIFQEQGNFTCFI